MSLSTAAPKGTERVQRLLEIERDEQKRWDEKKIHEVEVADSPKFMVTFPYPYMNGKLHLGHAYSMSKCEFIAGYKRMKGFNTLWGFAFHVTGMPIAAASNKLRREIELYGNPPVFPTEEEEKPKEEIIAKQGFQGKKGKVAPKNLRQWDIMKSMGVEDIPSFQDPNKWLEYFTPLGMSDLKKFGIRVDWRRSFITTDANPQYDAFIKWQFRQLIKQGKLGYGRRLSIFSTLEKQPCADHDRSEGEGAIPQEYTLVKLKVLDKSFLGAAAAVVGERDVFLAPATLRPETMFGQTNCWILPEGEYGLYELNDKEILVMTARAAKNAAWQHLITQHDCDPVALATVKGADLIGCPLKAPLSKYEQVYLLPMAKVSMKKGTGIVTSVPADSPDDFHHFNAFKTKEDWRRKCNIKDEWVLPFDLVPVTVIDGIGDFPAQRYIVEKKMPVEDAHKEAYLKSWTDGHIVVDHPQFSGMKVKLARNAVKEYLISRGEAVAYSEPDRLVISRSSPDDECVVAYCAQWYLKYGTDEEWKNSVKQHIENNLECFHPSVKKAFSEVLEWFTEWPCSRNFGLGSRIPAEGGEKFVIDSLSDSTIYMAYYTIAHLIKDIPAEQLTDEVFDHVFHEKPLTSPTAIPEATLAQMRKEFQYWYPMDLRCSAKDLIQNHLTMALYNHSAIWGQKYMPRSYFCNGHILVDAEKMSKSKGNFRTLDEVVSSYGADATRLAVAEAGDTLDDANFATGVADSYVQKLAKELDWFEEILAKEGELRTGEYNFFDRVFLNVINKTIEQCDNFYNKMLFREVTTCAWHGLQNCRDQYRVNVRGDVHRNVVRRFIEVQCLVMTPIIPHWCEHVWRKFVGRDSFVISEPFPSVDAPVDAILDHTNEYLVSAIKELRGGLDKAKKKEAVDTAIVFARQRYQDWQLETLAFLKQVHDECNGIPADIAKRVPASLNPHKANVMPFIGFVKEWIAKFGARAFEPVLLINELVFLQELGSHIAKTLGIESIEVRDCDDAGAVDVMNMKSKSRLGQPSAAFIKKA